LEVGRAALGIDRRAIERELHDVVFLDAVRRPRARQQIALRIIGVAHADMAEAVHHALAGEDAVGGDELFDQVVQLGHRRFLELLSSYAVVLASAGTTGSRFNQRIKLTEPSVPSSCASISTRRSLMR